MAFNSFSYFLFLPLVYLVFYWSPPRARWAVLLAASLSFYAALEVPYLLAVLVLVTLVTHRFGCQLHRASSATARRALLWGGVGANLLVLVVMKYLPFLSGNLAALSARCSLDLPIAPLRGFVAIGVSYYIFQAVSYLIDISLNWRSRSRTSAISRCTWPSSRSSCRAPSNGPGICCRS